jgi:hypothetical protein
MEFDAKLAKKSRPVGLPPNKGKVNIQTKHAIVKLRAIVNNIQSIMFLFLSVFNYCDVCGRSNNHNTFLQYLYRYRVFVKRRGAKKCTGRLQVKVPGTLVVIDV